MYISRLPIKLNHDHAKRTEVEDGATILGQLEKDVKDFRKTNRSEW